MQPVQKHPEKRSTPVKQRLKLVAGGLVLILVGVMKIAGGVQVSTHWTGQPLFSWGLVTGALSVFSFL
jgi:hypothetical protein